MKNKSLIALAIACQLVSFSCESVPVVEAKVLRAPSVPLITSDPYLSIWSASDNLNDSKTVHWTGKENPMIGAIRVDGESYRFMGKEDMSLTPILPMQTKSAWDARYTESAPEGPWTSLDFKDNKWKKGKGAFANNAFKEYATLWDSKDIWVRRTFNLDTDLESQTIFLQYSHDDIFDLYINGIQVVKTGYEWHQNVTLKLNDEVLKSLKKGENIIAAHCHNKVGGAFVDFGLMRKNPIKSNFSEKAIQKSVMVDATQTKYVFQCGNVELELKFTAPLLMEDLDLVSTPINYISYAVKSLDKEAHEVQVYFETTPQLAVNSISQAITSEKLVVNNLTYLKTGTIEQPILEESGDDRRIDWGYLYLACELSDNESLELGEYFSMKEAFIKTGQLSTKRDAKSLAHDMRDEMTVLSYSNDLGQVAREKVSGKVMLGYDDLYS
ncbi:MAG: DUF5127 domain-containing protein, partial [Bacteroidales bacterium]|nr:DUF5127 domain-containing protein [Bacteroidales bacterium]